MTNDKFAIEVISKGSFVGEPYAGERYLVNTITFRANWIALNEYHSTHELNSRECYVDGSKGDKEWVVYQAKIRLNDWLWRKMVYEALGVENLIERSNITIKNVLSEIFTVVYIDEIGGKQ